LARYRADEDGNFGIMASVTSLMLVMSVGVSVEVSKIYASQSKVQNITDNLGLMAAVYMRDHETPPATSEQGFVDSVQYTMEEVNTGQSMPGLSGHFVVNYDTELGRANVEFDGEMSTSFMSAFHKDAVPLRASSAVKFRTFSKSAISVALIVDNSGSMGWDDKPRINGNRQNGTVKRIDALKDTAVKFNQNMVTTLVETNDDPDTRFLRIGLIPYNTHVIDSDVQQIEWGGLNENEINEMEDGGGTDTRGPMEKASDWMGLEDSFHEQESGEQAKKYVVLMSDGSNNGEWDCDWQPRRYTRLWRKWNGYRFDYKNSRWRPGSGWQEGRATNCQFQQLSSSQSLETCTDLKDDEVEIFTIGFALEPGNYYSDFPSASNVDISQETTDNAYDFLQACASSPENFIEAEDAAALDEAFEAIGKKIIQDNIRIEK